MPSPVATRPSHIVRRLLPVFSWPAEPVRTARDVSNEAVRGLTLGGDDFVEDLLLLARLDEGRPLQLRPVRLDDIAADAVRDARAAEPTRSITCDVEPVEVIGDDARLRQALANLLANARAHTPAVADVDVVVRRDGSSAIVEVADDGPGMTSDVAERVFERFFRADPARARASGGSGLGLAIVAGIAEAHHGTAEVESGPATSS